MCLGPCGVTGTVSSALPYVLSYSVGDLPAPAAGSATFNGKSCFDIAYSNDKYEHNGALSARVLTKSDFTGTGKHDGTQVYTFSSTGAVSNLSFVAVGGAGIVKSITPGADYSSVAAGSDATVTVVYEPALNDSLQGVTIDNAWGYTLYATYSGGSTAYAIGLDISMKDGNCCGAMISDTDWRTFMCHNLGAEELSSPFIPSRLLNGDYYQFGGKTPAGTRDAIIGTWSSSAPQASGNWESDNDPCPTGFRLPTMADWSGVLANNTVSEISGASWSSADNNYTTGLFYGSYLFLPAAGRRDNSSGTLESRDSAGYYWSSSAAGNTYVHVLFFNRFNRAISYYYRTNSFSVRCIAAE